MFFQGMFDKIESLSYEGHLVLWGNGRTTERWTGVYLACVLIFGVTIYVWGFNQFRWGIWWILIFLDGSTES